MLSLFGKITKRYHTTTLLLLLIIAIATFFRAYKLVANFDYAHDGDLFSWIIKDIVVDGHLRLIGQQTTAPGIFIGPAFYYILIPFFFLTNMDPVGAVIPVTLLGILTVLAYYYVFSKLFNKGIGLIASFLYGILLSNVFFDRRIVPSTPTNMWLVLYFYSISMISRGKLFVIPLLGFLIGLVWHIHVALLPALLIIPIALVVGKKTPSKKQVILFFTTLSIPSIPLVIFEAKHNFIQTLSFINNFSIDHGGGTGFDKLNLVLIKVSENIVRLFFYPQTLPFIDHKIFLLFFVIGALIILRKSLITKGELLVFAVWILTIISYYTFSSTQISEYYFANIEILFLGVAACVLHIFYKSSNAGKYIALAILAIIFIKNFVYIEATAVYHKGYNERKDAARFITNDSKGKNLPCVSVSYITSPGENVGFRYFFWLDKLKLTQITENSPTYSIVIPPELASGKDERLFGKIKVIPPEKISSKEKINESCSGQDSNLTDSMFGFTN